jgi:hypothetical protein
MNQKGDRERQHDQQLESAQKQRNPHRQLDPVVRKNPYNGKHNQRDQPPGDVYAEPGSQHVRQDVAEKTCGPCSARKFIDQIAPGGHETNTRPQPARRKGIVAAARRHVAGKLRHSIPNKKTNNGGQQEGERHVRSRLESDDRKGEHHVGRRSDMGDTLENQLRKSERVAS